MLSEKAWGPEKVGFRLEVNGEVPGPDHYTIDCEWTEDDEPVFVGVALVPTYGENVVRYFTALSRDLVDTLERSQLSGHGVKADFHELTRAGVRLKSEQLEHDSMILAYSQSSTREKYGLKDLAKEILGWTWPTYREIVGKGRGKKTLEKHENGVVARYCGMDAAATRQLIRYFAFGVSKWNRGIYYNLERPVYRCLYTLEKRGVLVDSGHLDEVCRRLTVERDRVAGVLQLCVSDYEARHHAPGSFFGGSGLRPLNPASPSQVMGRLFPALDIKAKDTDAGTLKELPPSDGITNLLRFRALSKLIGTYCSPLARLGEVHCRFNQVSLDRASDTGWGIRTGRLSSSGPNLQNIPSRTAEGKEIRRAFVPRQGKLLVCADYSQVEYRLLAHITGERVLVDAFLSGEDVHKETAKRILCIAGEASDEDRNIGKTINFAVMYGAQAKKIARTCGRSVEECQGFLDRYFTKLPRVVAWMQHVKHHAKVSGGVSTLLGRWIPLGSTKGLSTYDIYALERRAVNYIVQGSAADIIKVAMVRLCNMGLDVLLQVHDELILEVAEKDAERVAGIVEGVMKNVVHLSVPLDVDVGIGKNWLEAKEG